MRKLSAILLLCCIFLEIGGYFFIYRINKGIIRKEVRDYLLHHKNEFNQVTFLFQMENCVVTDPEFQWEEEHEFRYKGDMYDVIESTNKGDRIYIRCIRDHKESRLLTTFEKIVSGKTSGKSSRNDGQSFIQLLTSPYLQEDKTEFDFFSFSSTIVLSKENHELHGPAYEVLTPPPQYFLLS